jgi:hypothetical protein
MAAEYGKFALLMAATKRLRSREVFLTSRPRFKVAGWPEEGIEL